MAESIAGTSEAWVKAVQAAQASKEHRGHVAVLLPYAGANYQVEIAALRLPADAYDRRAKLPAPWATVTRWQLVARVDTEGAARTGANVDGAVVAQLLRRCVDGVDALFSPAPGLVAPLARSGLLLAFDHWRGGNVGGDAAVVQAGRWASLFLTLFRW